MPFSLSLPLVFRLWALYILALGIYKLLGLPYCGTLLHLPLHLTPIPPLFFCSLFDVLFFARHVFLWFCTVCFKTSILLSGPIYCCFRPTLCPCHARDLDIIIAVPLSYI